MTLWTRLSLAFGSSRRFLLYALFCLGDFLQGVTLGYATSLEQLDWSLNSSYLSPLPAEGLLTHCVSIHRSAPLRNDKYHMFETTRNERIAYRFG
ncbi:hypothetical protein BJY52DRAFT_1234954 [Lactarius psammicola]|nr:hypothetical protein BJY52DRAFT_1234954 [Lactarius psammicola]